MDLLSLDLTNINLLVFVAAYLLVPLLVTIALTITNRNRFSLVRYAIALGCLIAWFIPAGWVTYGYFTPGFLYNNKMLEGLYWLEGVVTVPAYFFIVLIICSLLVYTRLNKRGIG